MKNTENSKFRKKYRTPKFVEYGSVKQMTKSRPTGSFFDLDGQKMTMGT